MNPVTNSNFFGDKLKPFDIFGKRGKICNGVKKGLTLIETMVVVLLFSFLFGAIFTVLIASDRSWRTAKNKLIEQQEARKLMDNIARLLRQSKPGWITISSSDCQGRSKILFYIPIFNAAGDIIDTHWIIFKPNPDNCPQIIRKEKGDINWIPVAGEVEGIKFSGGDCLGCECDFSKTGCSDCINVTDNCPVVKIEIKTLKETGFTLASFVTARNYNISVSEVPEPPAEGEF